MREFVDLSMNDIFVSYARCLFYVSTTESSLCYYEDNYYFALSKLFTNLYDLFKCNFSNVHVCLFEYLIFELIKLIKLFEALF